MCRRYLSQLFDQAYLIGMHRAAATDGDIFARNETLVAEPKSYLVVVIALDIVEIPLAAGFAPQTADEILHPGRNRRTRQAA